MKKWLPQREKKEPSPKVKFAFRVFVCLQVFNVYGKMQGWKMLRFLKFEDFSAGFCFKNFAYSSSTIFCTKKNTEKNNFTNPVTVKNPN